MIYLIASVYFGDDRYRVETIDEDYGYFTTREAAQAWIDSKQDLAADYAKYVKNQTVRKDKAKAVFEETTRAWDMLKDQGINPPFFRPVHVQTVVIQTFEAWRETNEDWAIVEVHPNDD